MLNYKEIVEELDSEKLKRLLETLDIPYQETDDYLLMPTVCHHANIDDASWKLYFYKNTHLFYCFTEDGAMSIFKFLEHFYEAREYEYDWYKDVYCVAENCSNYSKEFNTLERYKPRRDMYKPRTVPELPMYSAAALDTFVKRYPIEWIRDGISREAMDKFNILYSISQNKIIIPHYDVNGRLIGIRGRALNEWEVENIGKYMPVKVEQTIYKHPLSMNLYGLYENLDNIREQGVVYIFEGEKSVLIMDSFEMSNCGVATCGSNLNIFQVKLLLKYCHPKEVIICFDKEELPYSEDYFYKLYKICEKYDNYANFSFIYDREHLTDLKDSPVDRGEEIFKRLLNKRVKVN